MSDGELPGLPRALLKAVLAEVLEERARVDPQTHGQHHVWIAERIEAERARKQMYWKIAENVAQWSVLGVLGWLCGAFEAVFKLIKYWVGG